MDVKKQRRFEEIIKNAAASFVNSESSGASLMTVTKVETDKYGEKMKIFFTVFPEEKEKDALEFLKRKRSDFRDFIKESARLARIPFFDFEIDKGEKNRIKVEEASKKK